MWGTVYLLHFLAPLGHERSAHAWAQHYIGWCEDLERRLQQHRCGQGAAITRAAVERGIRFECVATWPGDRAFERYIKGLKCAPRLCPICGKSHRRGPRCLSYVQLALPLDAPEEWPAPPRDVRPDWFETNYFRRPARRFDLGDTGGDIPW